MPETATKPLPDASGAPVELVNHLDPASIARRSISIFSRRGADATEPGRTSLSQVATAACSTKKMSDRQYTWLRKKRSSDVRRPHEQATILKAVPPAEKVQMSRLEQEMAISPNEEIMSAITASPHIPNLWDITPDHTMESHLRTSSSWLHPNNPWHSNAVQRTESVKRHETNNRIGVWVDGVAHWDEDVEQQLAPHFVAGLDSGDARLTFNVFRGSIPDPLPTSNVRPNLTVTIPGCEQSVPPTIPPRSQETALVAPANKVSRFQHVPPQIAVDAPTDGVQTPSAARPVTSTYHEIVHELQPGHRRVSSSTTSSTADQTDRSIYSQRSSITSIDQVTPTACQPARGLDLYKPLPRVPVPPFMRKAPAPPSSPVGGSKFSEHITRSAPGTRKGDRYSLENLRGGKKSYVRSLDLDAIDADFIRASPYAPSLSDTISEADSPTLSQAEHELQAQLGTIDEVLGPEDAAVTNAHERGFMADEMDGAHVDSVHLSDIQRSDSVRSVMHPPARAPTLPKRSRKRDWRDSPHANTVNPQVVQPPPKAPGRRKSESLAVQTLVILDDSDAGTKISRSESEKITSGITGRHGKGLVYTRSPGTFESTHTSQTAPVDGQDGTRNVQLAQVLSAEQVLLRILESLASQTDLSNMAVINKGMYRVFKENELHLIKTVARKQSSAAWELAEWRACTDADEDDDETAAKDRGPSLSGPTSLKYCRLQRGDNNTVLELKQLILDNCQTFMRRETALAFAHPNHPASQRFTDAFWRVWTFCTIFGSRKGREEDMTGQLDWLKGGAEANNQSFSATVNTNLDFDMGSVLLNAPEHFAQGNHGGLTAVQLYDITELWNCLSALLTGYQGQVDEARRCGVFASCGITEHDLETEEHMLEEWLAFVMTLGLDVILALAKHATTNTSLGFELAKANGWTDWSPPVAGSRATFFKEPTARLYEERISAASMEMQNPDDLEKKETSRKRVAALAAEIRVRRQTSGFKRLPLIDMHSERPMSMVSRQSSATPAQPPQMVPISNVHPAMRHHDYSIQHTRPLLPPAHDAIVSPLSHRPSTASARPSSPLSVWSSRHISPIIEGRVEAFNRLSLANLDGIAESTVELAVKKITDMGFTQAQATHALRMTDMGDGLRVDRAVDMLLRS